MSRQCLIRTPPTRAAGLAAPHDGQVRAKGEPHSMRNLRPWSFSLPLAEQFTWKPCWGQSVSYLNEMFTRDR